MPQRKYLGPGDFAHDLIIDLYTESAKFGYAKNGIMCIPELENVGNSIAATIIREFYVEQCDERDMYYTCRNICTMSMNIGIIAGAQWNKDCEIIKNGYFFPHIDEFYNRIAQIVKYDIGKDINQWNDYVTFITRRSIDAIIPYVHAYDEYAYMIGLLHSYFTLGVSIVYDKYISNWSKQTHSSEQIE